MATVTLEVEANPYYVRFQQNHPITGDLLFPGDVVMLVDGMISAKQVKDGVFIRQPDGTPTNVAPRAEPVPVVGVTVSEAQYEAKLALKALGETTVGTLPEKPPRK